MKTIKIIYVNPYKWIMRSWNSNYNMAT